MTRLIDEDTFIKNMSYLYEYAGWDEHDVHFSLADLKNNLDFEKTIEAIPIEWMKEWAKKEDETVGGMLYTSIVSIILTDWQLRKEE